MKRAIVVGMVAAMAVMVAVFSLCFGGGLNAQPAQTPTPTPTSTSTPDKESKVLIAYFSLSGNTKAVAQQLQGIVGGDMFEIKTVASYPSEYRSTTEVAKKELESNHRPALTAKVDDMGSYDVIFLGYPNWWATMPMALFTFLEQYDLSGKTIIPFSTHEGSRWGRSIDDLARMAPKSTIRAGFEIRGSKAGNARAELAKWVKQLGFGK